jgi:hypothetical protein
VPLDDRNRVSGCSSDTTLGGTASRSWSKKIRKRGSKRHEVVDEKADGACTLSQKTTILSHPKATSEPDGMFRQKRLEDCVS